MLTARVPDGLLKESATAYSSNTSRYLQPYFLIRIICTSKFLSERGHRFFSHQCSCFALTAQIYGSMAIELWIVSISILTLSFTFESNQTASLYTWYPYKANMA